ncbi:MAG TPA: TonB-dependent receptor [Vicinamibacterales bacterium]|nr:TonB-dependent receptor [Vicinamibacterales bacterium]
MLSSTIARRACAIALAWSAAATAAAQQPVPSLSPPQPGTSSAVTGQVRQAGSLKPIANATIIVEGVALETTSDAQGRFSIANVPPGAQHLIIAAPGFMPLRIDVAVGPTPLPPLDVLLDTEVHYTEVLSVHPEGRDQFAAYQPTSVLAGQELTQELETTLGATLERQPGVAERSFGPGPSRPVIRGLDGDRVLILEDGQRVGDLSSQSGDHGVTVNPASASRIEVVRGPATLLYGANAIGGLVNVISDTIPIAAVRGTRGGIVLDLGSGADEFGTAGDVMWGNGRWAVHASGSGRRNGDVRTPAGRVENTQSRGGFGTFGVSWTEDNRYLGGSYGYDDTKYGVPFIEEGRIQLTPRRHMFGLKAGANQLGGFIDSVRASFAARRYRHEELEGDEVGTRFENDTTDAELMLRQRAAGRLTGTVGISLRTRAFSALGEEALAPPVDERVYAAFFYEELTWPHATFQFGARVNHATYEPEEELPSRAFTDLSGSIGLLLRPAAANDRLTVAFSIARAARNPALEELYFFGPHPGNFSFEVGNSGLDSETAFGFDASVRWRLRRATGEVTYFRNSIDDYIFRNPISDEEFDRRFGHAAHASEDEEHGEFPIIEFVAADSLLQGVEAHADVELGRGFAAEAGFDYVRGELTGSNQPLPRIPPLRIRGGLRYQRSALQVGGEVTAVARQDRVFGEETATDGYNLLRLYGSYSFGSDRQVHTITARLDNATDELYRNHLSLIKDFVPEMGRSFKLVYSFRF